MPPREGWGDIPSRLDFGDNGEIGEDNNDVLLLRLATGLMGSMSA